MSRPIVVALAILGLALQAVTAVNLSQTKNVQVDFDEKDIVPKTALKSLVPDTRAAGFIGNLEIGRRYSDETVFHRVMEFENPTNTVRSITLTLTVTNGIIHYISAVNDNGSYAVICDEPTTLGSSRGSINIRAAANTKSYLTIVAAAH